MARRKKRQGMDENARKYLDTRAIRNFEISLKVVREVQLSRLYW